MPPRIAIIDTNTLTAIGLKGLLQEVVPVAEVETFSTFEELASSSPEQFFHYFASMSIVIANRQFFLDNRRRTIVLAASDDARLSGFHCLNTGQSESQLVKSILSLEQAAHSHGRHLPPMPDESHSRKVLSGREIEVLSLVVQGFINKEIADRLNISLSTVITHRRNIMEKLGARSVSSLTIYAVTNGYVSVDMI